MLIAVGGQLLSSPGTGRGILVKSRTNPGPAWVCVSGSPPAACQEVKGRKVGRKYLPQVIEKHISRSFWMSGSSPAAFQEAHSFRMARKSFPQIIQRTFFNRLGCPAACLQPSRRSRPPDGQDTFSHRCRGKDFLAMPGVRQLACSLPGSPSRKMARICSTEL